MLPFHAIPLVSIILANHVALHTANDSGLIHWSETPAVNWHAFELGVNITHLLKNTTHPAVERQRHERYKFYTLPFPQAYGILHNLVIRVRLPAGILNVINLCKILEEGSPWGLHSCTEDILLDTSVPPTVTAGT